jgi:hypothetical protein
MGTRDPCLLMHRGMDKSCGWGEKCGKLHGIWSMRAGSELVRLVLLSPCLSPPTQLFLHLLIRLQLLTI